MCFSSSLEDAFQWRSFEKFQKVNEVFHEEVFHEVARLQPRVCKMKKKDSIAGSFHGIFTKFVRDWFFVEHLNTAASNAK